MNTDYLNRISYRTPMRTITPTRRFLARRRDAWLCNARRHLVIMVAVLLSACGTHADKQSPLANNSQSDKPANSLQQDAEGATGLADKQTIEVLDAGSELDETIAEINSAILPPASSDTNRTIGSAAPVTASEMDKVIDDADDDGVSDEDDNCPDTPAGHIVRTSGCSLFFGSIEKVDFPADAYRLSSEARASLAELVTGLNDYPAIVIALGGHTDNRGKALENLELSKQRVLAVVRYLLSNGVAVDRLKPYGYGESRPKVSNATAEGRAQNRRIELSVVGR